MQKLQSALLRLSRLHTALQDYAACRQGDLTTERGHLHFYRLCFAEAMAWAALFKACGVPLGDNMHRMIQVSVHNLSKYRHDHPELLDERVQQMDLFAVVKTESSPIHMEVHA